MELTKYKRNDVLAHIRHDLRQIPDGKDYGNESVDLSLSHLNYSLIDRPESASQVNKSRLDFEHTIYKYNRSNLVHAVELVVQCPSDCPPDQEKDFFQTAFDWFTENYLPAGKECVFLAEVHKDEHKYIKTQNGTMDLSKHHMHLAFVPAIPADKKHPEYKYRMNSDALTKRSILKQMHPSLQAELDRKGIQATVYRKKEGDGKNIPLTVKQLKELTQKTGLVLDKSITVDELANIITKNHELTAEVQKLNTKIESLHEVLREKEVQAENIWGASSGWGNTSGWGNKSGWGNTKNKEHEHIEEV